MILQTLKQLADREGLADDLDFEFRPVAWIVCLQGDGTLLNIIGTRQPVPNARGGRVRLEPRRMLVPRRPVGKSGTKAPAAFLVENAKYVFGLPTADKSLRVEDGKEKSGWFREQVEDCAKATGDPAAVAVARFLERVSSGEQAIVLPPDAKSNDLFGFAVDDAANLVHEREAVKAYWKQKRSEPACPADLPKRCLVSGDLFVSPGLFPLVGGVPGGATSGVSFVGFNQPAFESHGWNGNENAPISREAAEAASTALARLVARHPHNAAGPLPARFVRLSDDTLVLYWGASATSDDFADSIEGLLSAGEDDAAPVGDLYKSIWSGEVPDLSESSPFYALTVTGAQGRAALRDWIETSVREAAHNLAAYFRDLHVVRNTRSKSNSSGRPLSLRWLMAAISVRGQTSDVPDALAAQLVHAAFRKTKLPIALLQKALLRERAESTSREWADSMRRDARAALIKAVLIRNFGQEVTVAMDPANTNPGYLLGRLMAIVERMQQAALGGDVNATVVDRYFGGASATPAVVFPRLLKNMRNHARKAKDDESAGGTVRWLESQADGVLKDVKSFPAYLDIEQQGLFVLGYHHQRHQLWLPRAERTPNA